MAMERLQCRRESADSNSEYELSTVCRALRSQDAGWLPPKDPAGSGHMPDFITYWYSLSAVVLGHLAWSNPSLGMARWINSGMPGDDGVLSGLKRLYGADAAALILNRNVAEAADALTEKCLTAGAFVALPTMRRKTSAASPRLRGPSKKTPVGRQ